MQSTVGVRCISGFRLVSTRHAGSPTAAKKVSAMAARAALVMSDASGGMRKVRKIRSPAAGKKGNGPGIGAFSVAYIAGEIEGAKGPIVGRLKALEGAIAAARYFIQDFLAE